MNTLGRLSVGIVTYNDMDSIGETLDSLLASLPSGREVEVHVLDNASCDGTAQYLSDRALHETRLTVTLGEENVGFGRGHNRILESVNSDCHVFCNPDITLTPSSLPPLLDALESDSDVGLVCPRVLFSDGNLQPLNRLHPNLWDLFLRRFMPAKLRCWFKARMDRYSMLDVGYEVSCEVPFVSGAFMTGRTCMLQELGGFDPRYFLYFEDADLSRTVWQAGWRCIYCPEGVVTHQWRREAHTSLRGVLMFCTSAFRYFNKWGWALW